MRQVKGKDKREREGSWYVGDVGSNLTTKTCSFSII